MPRDVMPGRMCPVKGESASLTTRRDCRATIALNYCLVLSSLFQVSATHFLIFNLYIFPTSRGAPSLCCHCALLLCDKALLLVEVASLLIHLPDSICLPPPFSPHTVSYFLLLLLFWVSYARTQTFHEQRFYFLFDF